MKRLIFACLMAFSATSLAGTQNGTCSLHHGVYFCTGATETIASNACKTGTGFEPSGCSSEPGGLVGCQCDKQPSKSKYIGIKPAQTLKLK